METICLLLRDGKNKEILIRHLAKRYDVALENPYAPFDLALIDGATFHRVEEAIRKQKEKERPVYLPALLMVNRKDIQIYQHHLWKTVDDFLTLPVEIPELDAHIAIQLRTRNLSLELENLKKVHGSTVDLPLVAYVFTNRKGEIQKVNTYFCQWVGRGEEDICGKPLLSFLELHPLSSLRRRVKNPTELDGNVLAEEAFLLTSEEKKIPVLFHLASFHDPWGNIVGIRGALVDITPLKKAQEELEEALEKEKRLVDLLAHREIVMGKVEQAYKDIRKRLQDLGHSVDDFPEEAFFYGDGF